MIVTLLTDYGLADTYVGQVKAAILRIAPAAVLVDLTHNVPPQDVCAGAFLLWTAVPAFAPDTIHVAVVDPGVGTRRRAVAIKSRRGDVFVGPDNGLLVPAAERLGAIESAVELTDERYWGRERSSTFHGRDVFGPVAGHLANGVLLSEFGRAVEVDRSIQIPKPRGLEGEVIHVDAFGNLVTNFPATSLPASFAVEIAGRIIEDAPHPHFQAVAPGELCAVIGSAGLLEICARDGSAAPVLAAGRGSRVKIR